MFEHNLLYEYLNYVSLSFPPPPHQGHIINYCFSLCVHIVSPSVCLSVTNRVCSVTPKPLRYFDKTSHTCKAPSDEVSCTRTITLSYFSTYFPFIIFSHKLCLKYFDKTSHTCKASSTSIFSFSHIVFPNLFPWGG